MEYSKLVAVTGLPGLFELVNSKSDGAIVRSLNDKTTRFVSNRVHSFTHLESIEIYTVRDNVNLVDVLNAMDKEGGSLPDDKDAVAVKKYFEKAYPDMDFERVYASDMKKMLKWFDVLKKNNVEIVLSEIPEEEEDVAEPVAEEKPVKKTTAKKEPAEKEEVAEDSSAKITPKKTARKKKAD
ncbi:MAG: DUF5606 domain-containing protein [Chitinophagaceae bacterium]